MIFSSYENSIHRHSAAISVTPHVISFTVLKLSGIGVDALAAVVLALVGVANC